MQLLPIRRALLSVTHKTGLAELARFLDENGVELVSTGGTMRALEEAGCAVTAVSDVTGFPEILGGRVKTLHPHIHAPLLADKDSPDHLDVLADLDLEPFDLVCVNLYDFARAAADNLPLPEAVEQIDIGGPTLLRAAAKNFSSVAVLPDPEFYAEFMDQLVAGEMRVDFAFRLRMAREVFERTSRYDAMIAAYLAAVSGGGAGA